jgi:DNA polymerase V
MEELEERTTRLSIPDSETGEIDLHTYLSPGTEDQYILQVSGDGMTNAGILDGDLVIVDTTKPAMPEELVVVELRGNMYLRRMRETPSALLFTSEASLCETFEAEQGSFEIIGVVRGLARKY